MINTQRRSYAGSALLCLFFLSGLSGLIYQSIWSHYLKLVLGHAAYAQTLVLVMFMGGLSLGAWLASLFSHRIVAPLVWYAIIELVIGLFGVVFHNEFLFAHRIILGNLVNFSDSPLLSDILKWGTASLVILPQSILLGATFPLLSTALVRQEPQNGGYIIGALYFSNSIGAASGVLLSGFVLIEWLGLPGTSFVAGSINVLVALGAWIVFKLHTHQFSNQPILDTKSNIEFSGKERVTPLAWAMMGIAFFTGLASFFYEVGWIRMLSLVLGSSVQAFELMLCAFILGLALGSFYIRKRIDQLQSPLMFLAGVQLLMGVLATATLPLYVESFGWVGAIVNALGDSDGAYILYNISAQTIALVVMLPAAFMAGMTLPLLSNILMRRVSGESAIGKIYAANTLGAILGVVLAVHLVMPVFGVKFLIIFGSLIDIAVGVLILVAVSRLDWSRRQFLSAALAIVAVIIFSTTPFQSAVLSSGVYRSGKTQNIPSEGIKFYRDGKTSSIAYVEWPNGDRQVRTNGKPDAHIKSVDQNYGADEITMAMLGAVPLFIKPNATDVANIGLGSGLTSNVLLGSDRLKSLDTIEIETSVVEASRLFGPRVERVHNDPRSSIFIDDAKSYFASSQKSYDIIISEPSNPWMSGVASLYSVEFYSYVQQYLRPQGVFVQWLHLYESNIELVSSVFKALGAVFPNYQIYNSNDADILIVANMDGSAMKLDPWVFSQFQLRAEMERVELRSLADIEARYLGDKSTLGALADTYAVPANTDFYPYLGYKAPKAFHLKQSARELVGLHDARVPVLDWINNSSPNQAPGGQSLYFNASKKWRSAQALTSGRNYSELDSEDKLAALVTQADAVDHFSEKEIISALQLVAKAVNPYLNKSELNEFWNRKLTSFEGYGSEQVSLWIEFHRAISQKNNEKTLQLGETLLKEKFPVSNDQKQYIAIAMLTATVAHKDWSNSRELIQRFGLLANMDTLPLEMRLLVGIVLKNGS